MTSPESRSDGAPLDGGPRSRLRALGDTPGAEIPAPAAAEGRAAAPAVCPWLYLEGDPAANADHVVDSHSCELRPELAPDPGHQLAYCLSANHFSCPHLRSYTERRRTGAVGGPTILPVGGLPGRPSAQAPLPPAAASESWLNRGGWATLGALIALVVFGLLTLLYATPGAPTAATPGSVATPAATASADGGLAAGQPATALLTPEQLEDLANPVGAAAPDAPPAGESPPAEAEAGAAVDDLAATATPEPTPEPLPESYVVQPGDTLLLIAYQFGISVDSLLRANGLGFFSPIYSGQTLQLPAAQ